MPLFLELSSYELWMDCSAKWTMLESGAAFCTEEWKGTHLAALPYGELLNLTAHS